MIEEEKIVRGANDSSIATSPSPPGAPTGNSEPIESKPKQEETDWEIWFRSFLLLGFFILMPLMNLGLSLGGLIGPLLLSTAAAALFFFLLYWGKWSSYRFRAFTVLVGYITAILGFAWGYLWISRSDSNAFTITSSAVEQRRAKENLERNEPLLTALAVKRRDLEALKGNPKAILVAQQASLKAKQPEEGFVRLSPDREIRFSKVRRVVGKFDFEIDLLIVRTVEGTHLLTNEKPTIWGPEKDPLVVKLKGAGSEEEVSALVEEWAQATEEEHKTLSAQVADNRAGRAQLDFFDLCYFSTSTIATVGYGDIVPNSTAVRSIVMTEAIFGVLYIAFNISFLWPEKHSKPEQKEPVTTTGKKET